MSNFSKFLRHFPVWCNETRTEGNEATVKQLVATALDNKYYIGRIEELEHERDSLEARISELKDEKDALRTELISAIQAMQDQPREMDGFPLPWYPHGL